MLKSKVGLGLMALSSAVLLAFLMVSVLTYPVSAGIGSPNVTVQTFLDVGGVYPEVLNVSVEEDAASFSLTPAATKTLSCVARVRDFNGDADITNIEAEFFGTTSSTFGDSDDNNYHYTNASCEVNDSFVTWQGHADDAYTVLANCTYEVEYYANPEDWNCTVTVNDTYNWQDSGSDAITISELLALGLPDTINYGTVNATFVSDENITNVTNYGNVEINLSLEGYAQSEGDGYAMNCSLGSIGTIDIMYEKYNLSSATAGDLTLTEFEAAYTNLTSSSVIKEFNLEHRQNDVVNDAYNQTYWRIYVPRGVAGTCQGNIIFGATQATAS